MTEQAYIDVAARSGKPFTFTRIRAGVANQEFLPGEGTRLKFASRATDTLELVDLPVGFLVAGDVVTVAYLGTTVFRGEVDMVTRDYSRGDTQADTVTVSGPWAKMSRLVFRQNWKTSASGYSLSSRLILNQSDAGTAQNVNVALREICWGPNNVAPAACGYTLTQESEEANINVSSTITLPFDECRDITIADAIRRELRLFPAAVTYFDYSTATPTIKIQMPATSGSDAAYVASVSKTHRQYTYNPHPVDGVDLEIETIGDVGGVSYRNISHQTAGNTATNNPNCLYATLQLQGFSSSSVSQSFTAVVESMADGYGDPRGQLTEPSFWKAKHPNLANVPVGAIQILEATASDSATAAQYPNIAANTVGEIQAAGLRAHVATFTAKIKITTEDDVEENRILEMQFVTTNATNRTYTWLAESSSTEGETVPSGLAAAILAARSGALRAERFTMRLGTAAQWPTIGDLCDGLILQSFTVDPTNLTAELDFGAPEYLSPEDMAGLLTNFRNKRRPTLSTSRVTGNPADDATSDVNMGGVMPLKSTEFAPGTKSKTTFRTTGTRANASGTMVIDTTGASPKCEMTSTTAGSIKFDTAQVPSGSVAQMKKLSLYDGSTPVLEAMVLATDDYELQVKKIAGGPGISISESNGTITVSATGGGGGGGGGGEVSGYSGEVVVASLPSYDPSTHELKYTPVTLSLSNGLLQSVTQADSPTVITTAVEETA